MDKAEFDEAEKALWETIHQINLENSDPGLPCYTLAEMLERKEMADLQKMAELYLLENYSEMNKAAIVWGLQEAVLNLDCLYDILYDMNKDEWKLFCEASKVPALKRNNVASGLFHFLFAFGLMAMYYREDESQFYFVVPAEIQQALRELEENGVLAGKEHQMLLGEYAVAAVNLYGVITVNDFVNIFNRWNTRKITIEEVFSIFSGRAFNDTEHCIWEGYLVHYDFAANDFADVEYYAQTAAGKPRYLPTKTEFLKHSRWDYIEPTPQIAALRNFLRHQLAMDEEMTEDLIDEIVNRCKMEFHPRDYLELFDGIDISLSGNQIETLIRLMANVQNSTRNWLNNGHTPDEIHRMTPKRTGTIEDFFRPQKVGRNDPCPCGSGKKYKKCCGM